MIRQLLEKLFGRVVDRTTEDMDNRQLLLIVIVVCVLLWIITGREEKEEEPTLEPTAEDHKMANDEREAALARLRRDSTGKS